MTWRRPAWLGVAFAVELACAAWAFAVTSGVSYWTGLYFAVTTATTVGYGDVSPRGGAARLIAVLFMLTAIPLLGMIWTSVTGLHVKGHVHAALREHEQARRRSSSDAGH